MRAPIHRLIMLALAASIPLLASCAPDWDPQHLANKFRVLTIKAEPPEVQIDPNLFDEDPQNDTLPQPVTLTALVSPPAGEESLDDVEITYRWTACFASLGAIAEFGCVIPELEIPIPGDGSTVQLNLALLLIELGARVQNLPLGDGGMGGMDGASGVGEQGITETCTSDLSCCQQQKQDTKRRTAGEPPLYNSPCPDFLEPFGCQIQITLEAGPVGAETVVAVRDIRLDFDSFAAPNQNPVVTALRVEGTPTRGGEVQLIAELDEGSLEPYVNVDCAEVTEEPVLSFLTTAGKIDPPVLYGDQRGTTLVLPTDPEIDEVQVHVVVRDADTRQGVDFASATIKLGD